MPANELLAAYRPGTCSLFVTPSGVLLARGVRAALPRSGGSAGWVGLPERVGELLAAAAGTGERTVAVAAVPFDHDSPAQVYVPFEVRRAQGRPDLTPRWSAPSADAAAWKAKHEPEPQGYAAAVAEAVRRLEASPLEKVVLARTVRLTAPADIDVRALVARLVRQDPTGYTFAIDLVTDGAAPLTFVGASPELLVRREGRTILAVPQAGTTPRGPDDASDRASAAALLASDKDRREHEIVVRHVAGALRPLCRSLTVPAEPRLASTGTVWHLASRIIGELTDPAITSFDVACALHPTPAVCGTPTELARGTVAELEPFDRGCYAGAVGWTDSAGDGEWVVAIRSAEVQGQRMRLFAGAGIVAGSDPWAEVRETSTKFRTLLDAMGLDLEL